MRQTVLRSHTTEWSYRAGVTLEDPFAQLSVAAVVTTPSGGERRVPAFWRGEDRWTVRYSSYEVGVHHFRMEASDDRALGVHGQEGSVDVLPYDGGNELLRRGALQRRPGHGTADTPNHLAHADGTPFPWLGDTWWMGLTSRLDWPTGYQELTADRVDKGFTLVQIVAGLYPDMDPYDERGTNAAGCAWERANGDASSREPLSPHAGPPGPPGESRALVDMARPNVAWWDLADQKVAHLVDSGLVPCVVACWGYFMELAGEEVMRRHWDYIVARWGSYPVVWCVAGEALSRFYRTGTEWSQADVDAGERSQRAAWTRVMHHLRDTDPFARPITIHPSMYGHLMVDDPDALDVNMLQTGHWGMSSIATNANMIEEAVQREPPIPVIMSEGCYEGIRSSCYADVQRLLFYSTLLSGAYGFTYGANGLWQAALEGGYGASPHGVSWGDTTWREAAALPGGAHVGVGLRLLRRYRWWGFTPHPEWLAHHASVADRVAPYAGGIEGEVRVMFLPAIAGEALFEGVRINERDRGGGGSGASAPAIPAKLQGERARLAALYAGGMPPVLGIAAEPGYTAYFHDPMRGEDVDLGTVVPDQEGSWRPPTPPIFQDWVLVLETADARQA